MQILRALPSDDALIAVARTLFQEYERELGENLCFQGFAEELAGLPGPYGPPTGALLLAELGGAWIGCVALKQLEARVCEMKRLYVRPAFRGQAVGRELVEEILAEGARLGYARMRLDTLVRLVPALVLYRSFGFREIESYYGNPLEGVVYLEKVLRGEG
jgi:putative acetyltransferase